jgi:hypothetical protein
MPDTRGEIAVRRERQSRDDFVQAEKSIERAPQQAEEFFREPGKFDPRHRGARVNHNVPSVWYLRHVGPQNFANAPANPIAHNRAAQSFFYTGAETAAFRSIPADEKNELRTRATLASAVHRFIFDATQQASGTRVAPVRSGHSSDLRRA